MEHENTIIMKQNTVATLQGVRIGNGNYYDRDYEMPDGTTKNGLAAKLFFPEKEDNRIIGAGAIFTVKEKQYLVVEIGKQLRDRPYGFIRIKEVE